MTLFSYVPLCASFHKRLENIEFCAYATGKAVQRNRNRLKFEFELLLHFTSIFQLNTNDHHFQSIAKILLTEANAPSLHGCVRVCANFDSKHLTVYIDFEWVFFVFGVFFALSLDLNTRWKHQKYTHACIRCVAPQNERKKERSFGKHIESESGHNAVSFFPYAHLSFACYECLTGIAHCYCVLSLCVCCWWNRFECASEKDAA